jgi:hypothetical protein
MNFTCLTNKHRKMEQQMDTLKTQQALEKIYKQANKRAIQRMSQPSGHWYQTLRPQQPKEFQSDDDIANDLSTRLRPYMLNNNEVVTFISALRQANRLTYFADLFGQFERDYLVGVYRMTARSLDNLFRGFEMKKLLPPPVALPVPAIAGP